MAEGHAYKTAGMHPTSENKTFSVTLLVCKADCSKTFSVALLVCKGDGSKTFSVTLLVYKADFTKTFSVRLLVYNADCSKTFSVTLLVYKADCSRFLLVLTLFLNLRFQMQHIQSSPKRPRILNRCGRRPRLQNRRHAPNIRNPKI